MELNCLVAFAEFLFSNVLGRRRYDRKQQGFGGQTKPIFRKKVRHFDSKWSGKLGGNYQSKTTGCWFFIKLIPPILNSRQRQPRKLCCVWNVPNANIANNPHWKDASILNWEATRKERVKWFSSKQWIFNINILHVFITFLKFQNKDRYWKNVRICFICGLKKFEFW